MMVTLSVLGCSRTSQIKTVRSFSSYVDSIEVIPLETTSNSLIGYVRTEHIFVSDSCVILSDIKNNKIMCFDRKGKFKYTIGNRGRAGNEFYYNHSPIYIPKYGIYLKNQNDDYIRYRFDGQCIGTVPGPKLDSRKSMTEQGAPTGWFAFDEDNIAVYFYNTIGTVSELLGIYSATSGELKYMHKNTNVCSIPHDYIFTTGGGK